MSKRTIVIVAVVAILGLLGCCCAGGAFFLLGRGGGSGVTYRYSEDQQAVIDDLGMPNDFTVMFGQAANEALNEKGAQPTHRVEYWNYRSSRVMVVFRDGRFVRQSTLAPLPEGEWTSPQLEPSEVREGMTAQQVLELIGENPEGGVKSTPASGLGLVTVSWGKQQVLATFEDGKIALLRTAPVKKPE